MNVINLFYANCMMAEVIVDSQQLQNIVDYTRPCSVELVPCQGFDNDPLNFDLIADYDQDEFGSIDLFFEYADKHPDEIGIVFVRDGFRGVDLPIESKYKRAEKPNYIDFANASIALIS